MKMSDGVVATSYSKGDKFFIDPQASSAAGTAGVCLGPAAGCGWIVARPACLL